MRKNVVLSVALILGMVVCSIGTEAAVEKPEGRNISESSENAILMSGNVSENQLDTGEAEEMSRSVLEDAVSDNNEESLESKGALNDNVSENKDDSLSDNQSNAEGTDSSVSENIVSGNEEAVNPNDSERLDVGCLQIPQKLGVTIDPLEVDGRGQIYSDEYEIRNTGKTTGVFRLYDLTCGHRKGSQVIIREDKEGLHEGEQPFIYMEIIFEKKDKIILTEKASEYTIELEPGEGLSFYFTGEVNENALEKWGDQGIVINALYSWEREEEKTETRENAESQDLENSLSENSLSENVAETNEEEAVTEEPIRESEENIEEPEREGEGYIEEQAERIDLTQELQEMSISINSWKMDEKGKLRSAEYILRNNGENAGELSISLPDSTDERQEKDGERLGSNSENSMDVLPDAPGEENSVQVKMAYGNGKGIVLSGNSLGHRFRLEPEEEMPVRFEVEIDAQMPEGWQNENEDIIVTALLFWNTGE